jgi:hypothetical protein
MDGFKQTGAYDVLFELAHGGMGAVYLARAVGEPVGMGGFERLVAIKRLHIHLTSRADSVQRFLDEAMVAARIHHANVVSIHQVGTDEAGHFLVQDYVEGDTLQGLVDYATLKRRRLPPPVVLRIALDALAGLHAVHEATGADGRPLGILHRDVSAQNLLVGRDGVTRLADFGIAKHAESSVVTDRQYLQGRVLCMPPEYLARKPVDRRFDVYGMGVVLHTALAGDVPWPDATDAQVAHLASTEGLPPLSASGLVIAPAIEAIVARACAREPAARFPTARAMLEAIEELGRHTGWIASHGEVAALVEDLAGRELAARRATVARSRGQSLSGTPRATAVTVPRERPNRMGRGALALSALAVVLGTVALAGATRNYHPTSLTGALPPAASAATGAFGSSGSPSLLVATPSTAAPTAEPSPPAPVGVTPVEAPRAVVPAPHRTAEPRAVPRPSPVSPASPPPPANGPSDPKPARGWAPAGDPAAITTANPYR